MSPSPGLGLLLSYSMYLLVLLACVLWCLESHPIPMKITSEPLYDNHMAVCAEIQKDLSADNTTYNGYFKRPQNTSEESCYGKFIKDFISTLKNLMKDNKNEHLQKVYENIKHLTQICTKLQPKGSPKNCTSEYSDFTQFKEALKSVILYGNHVTGLRVASETVLSWEPGIYG